ncbi:hypothetical protein G9A89_019294 [Geosiphon pyriformis]|nr:hypothetical protein G9A89_019294 [Geosiphon pyriformis]
MSCCQYLCEMTTAKESREKNLPGMPTKTGKPTMIQKNQLGNKKKRQKKGKRKEERLISTSTTTYNSYTTPQQSVYCHPKLVCVNCDKKLSSMGAYCSDNKEYTLATKFYCYPCVLERFGRPKQIEKWDNKLCLACGETFLDKEIWNNIPR